MDSAILARFWRVGKMVNYIEGTQVLTNDQDVDCAWCNEEQGIPQGNGSHGTCERCAHRVYAQWQLGKVPSYIGERKKFNEYKENKGRAR